MVNIVVSIIYLLVSFIVTLLIFKFCGKYGLFLWMSVLVIISNIQTIKVSDFFGLTVSLGNIPYGALFLTTDILNERYGRKFANISIKVSFFIMIIFTILMQLFLQYVPGSNDFSQEALGIIFSYIPIITFASLLAYLISQLCDSYIYDFLKKKYRKVWISNNVSTLISQIIDTFIFVFISFYSKMNLYDLFILSVTMIIFKWIIALLDTPFMIISTKIKTKELSDYEK